MEMSVQGNATLGGTRDIGAANMPLSLRHGVVAASAPGMAAEDSFQREPESFERTILAEGLESILAAGRSKPATGRFQRGNANLIELYQKYERGRKYRFETHRISSPLNSVGVPRLERGTPCSQSRCATNCATPRIPVLQRMGGQS